MRSHSFLGKNFVSKDKYIFLATLHFEINHRNSTSNFQGQFSREEKSKTEIATPSEDHVSRIFSQREIWSRPGMQSSRTNDRFAGLENIASFRDVVAG